MPQKTKSNIPMKAPLADATLAEFKKHGKEALFLPADIASLVIFRIVFGLILLWEVFRYFERNFITNYWVKPGFLFSYWPFDFVKRLPGDGMYLLYYFLGILAVCITIGLFYRFSIIFFFLAITYSFLLDQARYLNHMYLISLISLVLIFLPANKAFAADTWIFKNRSDVQPAWPVWLLRFTVGLPYFFGGIAKLNSDWLHGEPLRTWLAFDTDFPLIGRYFNEEWMIYVMSYAGLLFDLLIIPLLLFKRTRIWAFIFMILFNLMNAKLFQIGIFPWFMIFATTIFFHPSWPRKIVQGWNRPLVQPGDSIFNRHKKIVLAGLTLWCMIHILVPLRHFLIPGNVHWTEEGHKYAWHMKLRSKNGVADFHVIDKRSGELIPINNYHFLTSAQVKKMSGNPDMLWQFARMLKSEYAKHGIDVSVHADVQVSLNGRIYQQMVSPETDISLVPRPVLGHASWIIPLKTSLDQRIPDEEDKGEE